MSNIILKEDSSFKQKYFSKDSLLKNFLAISVIYVSILSIASYFVYSPIISYSLFVFSLLLFVLRVLFVRKKVSYNVASLLTISLILFCLVPVCSYLSGGLYSPILWWYIVVPIISLLLFGRGLKTTILTSSSVLFILIFAYLKLTNYNLPAYDNSRFHIGTTISLLGLLLFSYTITWIFETQKSFAYKKLIDEKERLRLSEEGFRDIFDNTDELIQNISFSDAKFLMVNPTWLKTLEYNADEIENLTFEDIIHQDNKDDYIILINRLKNEKSIDNIQLVFISKTGKKVFVEGETGVMFKEEVPISIRGIFRNVTLKKNAELDIQKSRLALEHAQELAQLGNWEINFANNVSTWSKEMYRIFEIDDHITGNGIHYAVKNKLTESNHTIVDTLLRDVFEKQQVLSHELKITTDQNQVKYVNLLAEPLRSQKNKKVIGVKGTAQDITKQKLAVLAKSNFLSTMSHEIRTPINGVLGIANLLKSENLTDQQKEYVETLHLSSEHLLSIVSEILDFSKLESGNFTLEYKPFNLFEVCKSIFNTFQAQAIKNGLQLNFVADSNHTINVKGDHQRLSQVLSNLISNAIKFTKEGSIDFTYSIKETDDKVSTLFTIKDTGIGIAQEFQPKIFDTFSQVDDTNTRAYGGTGLGLAISKRLVDLQNGKLYLESEIGKGATFFVELLFEKLPNDIVENVAEFSFTNAVENHIPDNDKVILELEPAPKKLEGMRILIAEDNAVNAMVLTRFLTKWGIEYDVAKNGQLAIDKLETKQYDLILMDLQMPIMGGKEATKIIRNSSNSFNAIPIIALTANAILDNQSEIIDEGFNECILKPFNPDNLFNTIAVYHN